MKEIKYTAKGFTNSNNEYVTIDSSDMADLVNRAIMTMSIYAELTAMSAGAGFVCERNRDLFGKRGKAKYAPGRENTRLSVLGGFVSNYFTKQDSFRNDISTNQIPYLTNVLNEECDQLGFEPVVFKQQLFDFGK